jgi:hypothetical protein
MGIQIGIDASVHGEYGEIRGKMAYFLFVAYIDHG